MGSFAETPSKTLRILSFRSSSRGAGPENELPFGNGKLQFPADIVASHDHPRLLIAAFRYLRSGL